LVNQNIQWADKISMALSLTDIREMVTESRLS